MGKLCTLIQRAQSLVKKWLVSCTRAFFFVSPKKSGKESVCIRTISGPFPVPFTSPFRRGTTHSLSISLCLVFIRAVSVRLSHRYGLMAETIFHPDMYSSQCKKKIYSFFKTRPITKRRVQLNRFFLEKMKDSMWFWFFLIQNIHKNKLSKALFIINDYTVCITGGIQREGKISENDNRQQWAENKINGRK